MPDEKPTKGEIGLALLSLFPPAIRASVLEEQAFRQCFDLAVDVVIRLDPSGVKSGPFQAVQCSPQTVDCQRFECGSDIERRASMDSCIQQRQREHPSYS